MYPLVHPGFVGVETVGGAGRVHSDFSAGGEGLIIVRTVPIRGPLPDIPCHIEQAVSIGWEGSHGSGSRVSVFTCVCIREVPLKCICPVFTAGPKLIAPGVAFAI